MRRGERENSKTGGGRGQRNNPSTVLEGEETGKERTEKGNYSKINTGVK